MIRSSSDPLVAVVGGGVAGLTAAAFLARHGRRVTVLERAAEPGGRARTRAQGGYRFNQGAHALYNLGAAARALKDLGVRIPGAAPPSRGLLALLDGRLELLPTSPLAVVRTGLLPLRSKLKLAGLFATLPKRGGAGWRGRTVREWIDATTDEPRLGLLLEALVRLSGYANDPARLDAGIALDQLGLAARGNVRYVHDGWATVVTGLCDAIERHGGEIRLGTQVTSLTSAGGAVTGVRLAGGEAIEAARVVLALPPGPAGRLAATSGGRVPPPAELLPVRAACLDLGLRRLPRPDRPFALGLDRPTYLSVHSASARLADNGKALVHLLWYLGHARPRREEIEAELGGLMDLVQPGWRDEVEQQRLLPDMTVSHALYRADGGRPAADATGVDGLWLAGDWVGSEGLLADAAAASGRAVAVAILGGKEGRQAA